MPSPLDTLRAAGFSDEETNQWATSQRETLSGAGFQPHEIDAYLAGGVAVPLEPPKPLLERFSPDAMKQILSGAEAMMTAGARSAGSVFADLGTGVAKGAIEELPSLREKFPAMSVPEKVGAFVGRMTIGTLREAVVGGTETLEKTMRGEPVSAEEMLSAAMLGAHFAKFPGGGTAFIGEAMRRSGTEVHMTRPVVSPTGETSIATIGGLPDTTDFVAASSVVSGADPLMPIQEKMLKLYQDQGLHPAEVAHDAATDVTISQDMLSSEPHLPKAYVAEPSPAPQAPPGEAPTSPIRSFSPEDLKVDASRFQFKEGGDQTGVTDRLQGVDQWDPIKAGLGVAYEDADGSTYVVDGHQRLALARRIAESDPTQQPKFNAFVLRAEDGISDADARAVAASKNIAEGTGTAVDAAKVLRDRPDLLDSLPPRSELVRQAQGLSRLSPDAFRMVVNDVVPANYASIVGRLVPDDPKLQGALVTLLAKTEPANAVQAESIVRQGIDAGLHTETQATLFGNEEVVSSLYAGRARILDHALKTLRRDRTVFQSIADNQSIIEELGNRLAQDENVKRAATDAQAVQILQTLANRRGPLGDALTSAARAVADGSADAAAATRNFVAELRRQAESGDLTRIAAGGGGSPLATASASAADQGAAGSAAAGIERDIHAIGPTEEARATDLVGQAITPAPEFSLTPPPTVEPREALPPNLERTAQGVQRVMPGMERSAVQAAAARETEGRGMMPPSGSDVVTPFPASLEQRPFPGEPGFIDDTASTRHPPEIVPNPGGGFDVHTNGPAGVLYAATREGAERLAAQHGFMSPPANQPTVAPGAPSAEPGLFERLITNEEGSVRFKQHGPRLTEAEQAIRNTIDYEATGARPWSWSRLYTHVVDDLNPIPSRAMGGETLLTSQNPYKMARLLRGNAGAAEGWILQGQRDFKTGERIGPSLKEIVGPIEGDFERFDIFAQSLRTLELEGLGIETGKNIAAARQVVGAGMERYSRPLAQLINYENNLAKYLVDSGVLSQAAHDAMLAKHTVYVPFFRAFDDEAAGAFRGGGSFQPSNPLHRIEGSERKTLPVLESVMRNTFMFIEQGRKNEAATALVDLLRGESDAHGTCGDISATHPRDTTAIPAGVPQTAPTPAAAAVEGAPRPDLFPDRGPIPTEPPVAARLVPNVTEDGVREAARKFLADNGLGDELFDFVASSAPPAEGQIRIFREGKPEVWDVGRDIAEAVKGLDRDSANLLTTILAPAARILRGGATLSPDFIPRNFMRDFFTAFVNAGHGIFSPIDTARGFYSAVMHDDSFARWMNAGGGNAELVAMDRRYLKENLRALETETGVLSRGWNVISHPIDTLRFVSMLSEQATRLGEFRRVEARELTAGADPKEAAQTAAFASREVTVDFSRIGASMRAMNMITAFLNANIQGVDRLGRAFRDNPVRTSLRIAAGITVPSALLWLMNHDDPDYRELPGWQRDLFWIIPVGSAPPSPLHIAQAEERGEEPKPSALFFFRMPKPFETGVAFGSGIERALDAYVAQIPDAGRNFAKTMWDALTPSFIPTMVAPILEQATNRSLLTDRNLIPKSLEGQLPEYQYNPYTTETAKKLGQLVGAFPGMRDTSVGSSPAAGVARALSTPILLENYVRGWTGGLGAYALQTADLALRKTEVLPDPPKPASTLADIPFIKAFVVRYPSASAESIQAFYDDYQNNKRYYDTWMARANLGDEDGMQRIEAAGGQRIFAQLDGITQTLNEHSRIIQLVWANPDIAPDEKRQLIDQYYFNEIQIARAGREQMRIIDAALASSAPVQ